MQVVQKSLSDRIVSFVTQICVLGVQELQDAGLEVYGSSLRHPGGHPAPSGAQCGVLRMPVGDLTNSGQRIRRNEFHIKQMYMQEMHV